MLLRTFRKGCQALADAGPSRPADRDSQGIGALEHQKPAIAGPLEARHARKVDDMAAVYPFEDLGIEKLFSFADGERAEIFPLAVVEFRVVRIRMNGGDLCNSDLRLLSVPFDRKGAF